MIGSCSRAYVELVNAPVHVVRALHCDLSPLGLLASCWANSPMVARSTPLRVAGGELMRDLRSGDLDGMADGGPEQVAAVVERDALGLRAPAPVGGARDQLVAARRVGVEACADARRAGPRRTGARTHS